MDSQLTKKSADFQFESTFEAVQNLKQIKKWINHRKIKSIIEAFLPFCLHNHILSCIAIMSLGYAIGKQKRVCEMIGDNFLKKLILVVSKAKPWMKEFFESISEQNLFITGSYVFCALHMDIKNVYKDESDFSESGPRDIDFVFKRNQTDDQSNFFSQLWDNWTIRGPKAKTAEDYRLQNQIEVNGFCIHPHEITKTKEGMNIDFILTKKKILKYLECFNCSGMQNIYSFKDKKLFIGDLEGLIRKRTTFYVNSNKNTPKEKSDFEILLQKYKEKLKRFSFKDLIRYEFEIFYNAQTYNYSYKGWKPADSHLFDKMNKSFKISEFDNVKKKCLEHSSSVIERSKSDVPEPLHRNLKEKSQKLQDRKEITLFEKIFDQFR